MDSQEVGWEESSWEVIRLPHPRTIPPLAVRPADQAYLERLARSRTAAVRTVTRAWILVA